jgi:chemotaxis protein MotB
VLQMQGQSTDLQKQLTDAKDTTAKLEDQRKQLEQATADAQTKQQAAAAAADQAKQQQDAAAKQASDEQAQLDQATQAQQTAQAKLTDLQKQADDLQKQIADSSTARDKAATDLQAAQKQLSEAQSQAAEAVQAAAVPNLRNDFDTKAAQALSGKPGVTMAGERLILQSDMLFAAGSTTISAPGKQILQQISDVLKAATTSLPHDADWILQVGGHADKSPGRIPNRDLSAARALSVVKAMEAAGVPSDHLVAAGFGDSQPIANESTPAAYAKNRRVEFEITQR